MINKKIHIGSLLKKYNLFSKKIECLDYHLQLSKFSVEYIESRTGLLDTTDETLLVYSIVELFDKCDCASQKFDDKVYLNVMRATQDQYISTPRINKNIFGGGRLFEDEGFGFGTEITSMYDDYVDSMADTDYGKKR